MSDSRVNIEITATTDGLKKGADKATQIIKGVGDKAKQSGRGSFGGLLGELSLIPSAATVAAGGMAAVGVALKSCVQDAAAFEVALDNVNTILKLDEDGAREYGRSVTDLARDLKLGITSTEAMAGAYEVASAGFMDAASSQEVLRAAMLAAKGGLTDTATAVDGITSVLNAYQLGASSATRVSDLMFQAVLDGKTTFPELASNIGEVISTAAQAKIPLEQLFAAIAHMTSQGIKTPQAMTALNAAMMQILAPSAEAKKALQEVGMSAEGLSKTLKTQGLAEVFNQIFAATNGDEGKLKAILGDINAIKAALVLAGGNAEKFAAEIQRMGDSSGATLQAAKTNSDNLASSWADLKAAASDLGKEIGGLTTGPLKGFTDTSRDAIDSIRDSMGRYQNDVDALDPFDLQVGYRVQAPADLETPTWIARWTDSFTQGEMVSKTTEKVQEFYRAHAEGKAIIGKTADELVRMGATQDQFGKAITMLQKEAEIAGGLAAQEKRAEARRLASVREAVLQEVQTRQRAADDQKAAQKQAADAEVAAQKERTDRVMAIHAELQRKLRIGVYETAQEELAARDRVLQAMVDAGLGQSAEAVKLKEERVRLARSAAAEEKDVAERAEAEAEKRREDRKRKREDDARQLLARRLQGIDTERAKEASTRDLSTQDEIAYQQRIVALYRKGTSERAQAEIALYSLKARLRQEDEAAQQRLNALDSELANARTDEIDDQIADLQDQMQVEQDAGRSTEAITRQIVALMREKLAVQQQIIDAATKERVEAEKKAGNDPRVKDKLQLVGEKQKADAARDSDREIRRTQRDQTKRAQDLAKANGDVAQSFRDIGNAAKTAGNQAAGGWHSNSHLPNAQTSTIDVTEFGYGGLAPYVPLSKRRKAGQAGGASGSPAQSAAASGPAGGAAGSAALPANTMTKEQADQVIALLGQIATNTKTQATGVGQSAGSGLASRLSEASYFSAG